MNTPIDPSYLTIHERLTRYPDSYTDEELRKISEWYLYRPLRGRWGKFPELAFLALDEREKNRYKKEEENG